MLDTSNSFLWRKLNKTGSRGKCFLKHWGKLILHSSINSETFLSVLTKPLPRNKSFGLLYCSHFSNHSFSPKFICGKEASKSYQTPASVCNKHVNCFLGSPFKLAHAAPITSPEIHGSVAAINVFPLNTINLCKVSLIWS